MHKSLRTLLIILVCLLSRGAAADSLHIHGANAMTPAMKDRLALSERIVPRFKNFAPQFFSLINRCEVWTEAKPLQVCFVDSDPTYRSEFVAVSQSWLSYRPAYFDFGSAPGFNTCSGARTEAVRVAFRETTGAGEIAGNWGCVGKSSLQPTTECGKSDVSLNINPNTFDKNASSAKFKYAVLHEMGHALGLEHEHQNPQARCWDEIDEGVAEVFYDPMPLDQIRKMFEVLLDRNVEVSNFDNASVMLYALPITLFKQRDPVPQCFSDIHPQLSTADQTVIKKYYPASGLTRTTCLDDGSWLVSGLELTRAQKTALGAELTPLLSIGAAPGAKFSLALKPETQLPAFHPSAKGPAFPEALAPEASRELSARAPSDCTPDAVRGSASCSLAADGSELQFSIGP